MLATLVNEPFDSPDWLFEIKWDGYRAIAQTGKQTLLYSRNLQSFETKFPEIFSELRALKDRAVLDGEIVALDKDGKSHFGWLQNYQQQPQGNLHFFIFDLLWLNGRNLMKLPLRQRKQLLKGISLGGRLKYSSHMMAKGKDFFNVAAKQQLEGIMAKQIDSSYTPGARSNQWLKIKTHLRQEVVIAGLTAGRGSRKHFGALVLGVYEKGRLKYVGHTGGVGGDAQRADLKRRLKKLMCKTSPFKEVPKTNAPVTWVEPKLVGEVSFTEWTDDGYMRHPIFVGLREDKDPKAVRRELPLAGKSVRKRA